MIIEKEILEQMVDDPPWDLPRVVKFIAKIKDPWVVLAWLYKERAIEFVNSDGSRLQPFEVERAMREKDSQAEGVFVAVTEKGRGDFA